MANGTRGNFRAFALACSFFVVILVLFGVLRLKRVSRGNSRAFWALQLLRCSFFVAILVLFVGLGGFVAGVFIVTLVFFLLFWLFNFFDAHFSW